MKKKITRHMPAHGDDVGIKFKSNIFPSACRLYRYQKSRNPWEQGCL